MMSIIVPKLPSEAERGCMPLSEPKPGTQDCYLAASKLQNYSITKLPNFSLHHSPLRNPNVVAGRVLYQIHHLVGLPDDVMRVARVVRICCEPNRSPNIQIQSLIAAEVARPHSIA